jgi:excisionase family DNA binding protein
VSISPRFATPAETHRYASLLDTADYAKVHPRTVRRWIAAGLLTGYRVGPRVVRVDLNEVDQLMTPIPSASTGGGHDVPAA